MLWKAVKNDSGKSIKTINTAVRNTGTKQNKKYQMRKEKILYVLPVEKNVMDTNAGNAQWKRKDLG